MEKTLKKRRLIFVLPTLLAFLIGFVIPFIQGLILSFYQFSTVKNIQFIGIKNYLDALKDPQFFASFRFTLFFALTAVILVNSLAFFLALLLTKKLKGTSLFRSIFFMPNLIGGIVLGYIWQILLNGCLILWHKPLLALNASAGYWGLVFLTLWQQVGYMMIIYIASLTQLSVDVIEAAKIDGARDYQILWKVKIPMMMPSFTVCIFLTLTNALKLYDQNLALTAGDPYKLTEMLALNITNTFYSRSGIQWKGIGQAKAVLFCLFVIAFAWLQLKATKDKEVQS